MLPGRAGEAQPAPVLSDLVFSDSFVDRVRAGLVIELLVSPGVTLKRRVENIALVASNVNERTTALDLDLSSARGVGSAIGVRVDCAVLSLAPKALMSGFQVKASDGAVQSAAQRTADSRMAQCFLVALALSRQPGLPGLQMPSQRIWTLIYEHCFRFPMNYNPYEGFAHAVSLGLDLEEDDRHWWVSACMSDLWRSWLLKLGDLFMVMTAVAPDSGLQHYEFTRRSGRDPVPNPGVARALVKPANPETPLAIRLYDLGHAASEHIHLHAAEGTFLSGGFLAQRDEATSARPRSAPKLQAAVELLKYRRRPSRHELVVYVERAKPGNCLLLANLWPDTRGFVTPVRYISYWVLALSVLAALTTIVAPLDDLRKAADATLMVVYLLPTIALGYLIQPDLQPEIRWRMLAWSRHYALILMIISVTLTLLWLYDPGEVAKYVVAAVDLLGAGIAAFVAWRINGVTDRIVVASDIAKRAEESGPPRGYPAALRISGR